MKGPLCAPGPKVIVVDEAGMVGTRDLTFLLRHANAHGRTHLVLVGDPRQLPEIEAGGLFARLAEKPTAVLTENRRQVAAWEQRALTRLRDGDTAAALDQYWARGRITFSATPDDLIYLRLRHADPCAGEGAGPDLRHHPGGGIGGADRRDVVHGDVARAHQQPALPRPRPAPRR